MLGIRLFALLMSFSLCEIWLHITRLMPTPMMKLGIIFITMFSGGAILFNMWRFQARSLMAYYTMLVCGVAFTMFGLLEIVHLVLGLPI